MSVPLGQGNCGLVFEIEPCAGNGRFVELTNAIVHDRNKFQPGEILS